MRGDRHKLAATAALLLVLGSHERTQAADGAYAVDDADVATPGNCKVETWYSAADNRDRVGALSTGCVFNLGRPVELNPQFERTRTGGVWGTGFTLQAKTNIVPVDPGKLGIALQGGPSFDLLTGESTGGFVLLPATYEFNDRFKINLNLGWKYQREPNWHWLTWGGGFEWKFVEGKPLTLIGEVFGQLGHRDREQPALARPRGQIGLRYRPIDTIDFDIIYGRNINGENAHWITAGVNLRFEASGAQPSAGTPRLVGK